MDKMYTADLGNGMFLNPIHYGFISQPQLKEGKDYYAIQGVMLDHNRWEFRMLRSRDLVNWVLDSIVKSNIRGSGMCLEKVDDTYYIYSFGFTEEAEWGKCNIWVMTAKNIHGPWTDPQIVIRNTPYIDPCLVVDRQGNRYLFLSYGMCIRLTNDGLHTDGDFQKIYPEWLLPEGYDVEGQNTEGPNFFWRDEYCYLILAEGGTYGPPTSHCSIALRAKDPMGPWELSPYNPIVHTENIHEAWWLKGHGCMVLGPDGETWYFVYLAYMNGRKDLGMMTLMEPVEWMDDDWFHIKPGSRPERPLPIPKGGEVLREMETLSDDFRNGTLSKKWLYMESDKTASRLSFEKAGLRLKCEGCGLHDTTPIFGRVNSASQEIMAEFTVEPGAGAGLTYYYNNIRSCGISLKDGVVRGWNSGRAWMGESYLTHKYEGNHIFLKLRNDQGIISPWYSSDGENWTKVNTCIYVVSWNVDSIDVGLGAVFPGMFAYGEGSVLIHQYKYKALRFER